MYKSKIEKGEEIIMELDEIDMELVLEKLRSRGVVYR